MRPETPRWQQTRYWADLPAWKRLILDDEELFTLRYFGHKIERLEDFHRDLMRQALYAPRALVLYPAGHGKTTLVSTVCPILELCRNPNVRMTGIFKNQNDAKGIGHAIQAELLGNQELIRDFGPFEPQDGKPFSVEWMSVAGRDLRGVKEPTLALFGAQSRSALGHRSDWTFCDDIVHDQNAGTPERREKLKEWFMQGPATQGDRSDSRLTVVGTRFDPEDLYADLLEMKLLGEDGAELQPLYDSREYAAILDPEKQTVLWPDYRPWQWLMQRKLEMGTLDFNKRFNNIAVDKSRMVFREEYIRGGYVGKQRYDGCLDTDYKVGDFGDNWRIVAGFDPAVGVSRSRKFCAHLVLAEGSCIAHERCFWVVDLEREQMTLPQQVELILNKHADYPLLSSIVEANSYQAGLLQAIQDKMRDAGLAYSVEPHYTTRTNKPDPELGVQTLAPWFENGQVHIPWGDAHSQRKMRQLADELVQYPSGRTTDTVLALWFAFKKLREGAARFRSYNRLAERKSIYRHMSGRRVLKNPAYS